MTALNGVLKYFCGMEVGGIQHVPGPDDLIYLIHHDQPFISKPLHGGLKPVTTKKKPDLIGTSPAHLASLCKEQPKPLGTLVDSIKRDPSRWEKIRKEHESHWEDCWNVLEVKFVKKITAVFPRYTEDGVLGRGEFFCY